MSVAELRQHVGRYITLSKWDIIKDLGNAIHEASGWDTDSPQVDPVAWPAMTDVKDTWSHSI